MPTPTAKPLYRVRRSPIHGTGVFATRRIPKGRRVIEYIGERISHAEADRRYENKAHDDNHTFLFTVNNRVVIDGGNIGNEARWINHSCNPNCESLIDDNRVFIEAIRTIQPGEELSYDYMIERDRSDPPDIDVIFACRCGAKNCRGTMLLPPKKKRKKAKAKAKAKATSQTGAKSKAAAGSRSKRKTAASKTERSPAVPAKHALSKTPSAGTPSAGTRSARSRSSTATGPTVEARTPRGTRPAR